MKPYLKTSKITSFKATVFIFYCFLGWKDAPVVTSAQIVNSKIGIIHGHIGSTVTLQCDLRDVFNGDPIIWYRPDRRLYLSFDDNIYHNVPNDIKSRVSVSCDREYPQDTCLLTITNATSSDNGTYSCGYQFSNYDGGTYKELSVGYLKISSYGVLPSDDSPICDVSKLSENDLRQSLPDGGVVVDDEIIFSCQTTGDHATIAPYLTVTRDGMTLRGPEKTVSLQYQLKVSDEDINATYACIMTHPGLSETRNCSVTLLPLIPEVLTSTDKPSSMIWTSRQSNEVTSLVTKPFQTSTEGTKAASTSDNPAVIVIPLLLIFFIGVAIMSLIFLIWRRRQLRNTIPKKPNYDLTINRDNSSITADYAAVHALDSLDKALELETVVESPAMTAQEGPNLHEGSDSQNGGAIPVYAKPNKMRTKMNMDNKNDTCPVYATPNKIKNVNTNGVVYENWCQPSDGEEGTKEGVSIDGLTYADLDLPASSISELPTKRNTTIYADIEGTL